MSESPGSAKSSIESPEMSRTQPGRRPAIRTVDVIILNWNGREHLETCLEAIWLQRGEEVLAGLSWQVVVVDNGSRDRSVPWLREQWIERGPKLAKPTGFEGVKLLESKENLGFCGGNNLAVEDSTADAVVLLNNDTAPYEDWLACLVSALQQAPADVAAVSGKLVDWEGQRVDFVEGVLTFDGHAFQRGFRKPLSSWQGPASGAELLFACGGNMIIRRSSFVAAGLFDPAYFAYLEDVDLGWRLWSGGERVLLCNEAVARHRSMATSDQLGQDRRGFLFERNAFLTVFKNYDEEFFHKVMPAVLSTLLARTRTLMAENNEGGELLRLDPYGQPSSRLAEVAAGEQVSPAPTPTFFQKWRGWGTKEFARRGVRRFRRRLARRIAPGPDPGSAKQGSGEPNLTEAVKPAGVFLDDPRTLAQLQAIHHLLENLDTATLQRQRVQERRKRSDREIFEKFPLALVPTYPGDEKLFADSGFRTLLPESVPLVEWTLADLMEMP